MSLGVGFIDCNKCPLRNKCESELWWEIDCYEGLRDYFDEKFKLRRDFEKSGIVDDVDGQNWKNFYRENSKYV